MEAAIADFRSAASTEQLVSTLNRMSALLAADPATRSAFPKEQIIKIAVDKRTAVADIWTHAAADAFGKVLASYAAPVVPRPAYEGQAMPPPYLFTPPPMYAPEWGSVPGSGPPGFGAPSAPPAADKGEYGAASAAGAPPAYDAAPPPYASGGAGGSGAGAVGGAGIPPPYAPATVDRPPDYTPPAPDAMTYVPQFYYAPPPAPSAPTASVPPAGAPAMVMGPYEATPAMLGVPVYDSAPDAEYTLDFGDGVETTTGALPCRPENLHRVTHINLWNNDVSRIEGLERYPNLMRLTLRSNEIRTLSGIGVAKNLRWVDVSDNDLKDLSGLDQMPSLEWLDIHNNDLPNLRGLAWCPNLSYLHAHHNDLRSLEGIQTLPGLRTVIISSNDLKDLKYLAHCKNLVEVNAASNDLRDVPSVLALATCPYLRTLDIRDNDFSAKDIKTIQNHFARMLPSCTVLTAGNGGSGGGGCSVM